jgi:hypothetical protein
VTTGEACKFSFAPLLALCGRILVGLSLWALVIAALLLFARLVP